MLEAHRPRERGGWTTTFALLLLALIPTLGSAQRLALLSEGATPTVDDARIAQAPVPMALHVVGATLFTVIGALQFPPALTRDRTRLHRALGWALGAFGILGALSGVWLALFLPRPADGNAINSTLRVIVGSAMTIFIVNATRAATQGSIREHRAWIIRAYAVASAAGTQAFVLAPLTLLSGVRPATVHTVALALGWAINVLVGDWIIRRRAATTSEPRQAPGATGERPLRS
jgi:uncharacterized membrane protein